MQYQPSPSYQGSYQPQSNLYGGQQHYQSQPSSYRYGTVHGTPQPNAHPGGYGALYAPATYQSTQETAYGSSSGAYESPRASKRPRLYSQNGDQTPTRSSGGWAPLTGNRPNGGGLALPPMPPPPAPMGYQTQQPVHENRDLESQQAQPHGISSHLESRVRGLADYSGASDIPQAAPAPPRPHQPQISQQITEQQTNSSPAQQIQPERGAKEGQILNLSCVMCMKKKRKCTKNFPCSECEKFGDECVPSVRKIRTTAATNTDQPPDEEAQQNEDDDNAPREGKKVVRDHNDHGRRYIQNLPRVIDGYQQWSNMSLPYRPVPENLDAVREKLFKLEKPILLNSQQYADYWPHISNVYARGVGPWWDSNGTQMETWECRNQRRQSRHQRAKEPGGQGLRKRERKLHLLEGTEMCRLRFRLTAHIRHAQDGREDHQKGLGSCNCVPDWLFMERMRASSDVDHNHTLDGLDKYKRTDALLFFAEQKVAEGGYLYTAVRKWIHDHYGQVTNTVQYLGDHDVANAARRWRVQNRDLELLETIPEPNPDDERRDKCLKLLPTTKLEGLQQALGEICTQLPEATKIALRILESSQVAGTDTAEKNSKILEGDEIVIPSPGIPGHRLNTLYKAPPPPSKPAQPIVSQVNNAGPLDSMPQQQGQRPQPLPIQEPPQYPHPHTQPLPPPPIPPQSQLPRLGPMPPPAPVNMQFHVYQPHKQAPAPSPVSGAYPVIAGGHRVQMPAEGSRLPAPVEYNRPSWARLDHPVPLKSTKEPPREKETVEKQPVEKPSAEKQNAETEEMSVQRQLEAELEA